MAKEKNVYSGTGVSSNEDPYLAGKEAVENAIKIAGKKPTFGFVFCSGGKYGKDEKTMKSFVKGANDAFKGATWIGATTCGELHTDGFANQSAVCLAVSSEFMHVSVGTADKASRNPKKAGAKAAKSALKNLKLDKQIDPYVHYVAMKNKTPGEFVKINPYNVVTLFPGTTKTKPGREDEILQGIVETVGPHIPIAGGSAADDIQFKETYQFANGEVFKDGVIVAYIVSNLLKSHFISHGYETTHNLASVTKSKGNIVKTLNGKPAAQVYADMIGIKYEELKKNIVPYIAKYPLGFPDGFGNFWIKNPEAVLADGSLMFFSPVPENSVLCLLEGTKKGCLNSVKKSLKGITKNLPDPAFSLIFTCAGRMAFMQQDIIEEYQTIKKELKKIPFIGFYTYGEQSSLPHGGSGSFNQTVVGLTFSNVLISE